MIAADLTSAMTVIRISTYLKTNRNADLAPILSKDAAPVLLITNASNVLLTSIRLLLVTNAKLAPNT